MKKAASFIAVGLVACAAPAVKASESHSKPLSPASMVAQGPTYPTPRVQRFDAHNSTTGCEGRKARSMSILCNKNGKAGTIVCPAGDAIYWHISGVLFWCNPSNHGLDKKADRVTTS